MPTPRIDEIDDRLAEMRLALPGLADRAPNALRFLARELDEIVAECSEWSHRWGATLAAARDLADEVSQTQREADSSAGEAGTIHTKV